LRHVFKTLTAVNALSSRALLSLLDSMTVMNGHHVRGQIVSSRDPLALPWKEMGIDLVIEGTGVFVDSKGAGKHIEVRGRCALSG
jgi:glyceraldehyde-3-phosphate dehydrogenase/erythrose-4-phosphate dehydrogenase